jgi:hypothetical protein
MLPLLLAGAGLAGSVGAYIWGKKQGEVEAYKDVSSNEPALSKLAKSVNSLIITVAGVGLVIFLIKKFK